ncbi:MAG: hypothetical protein FWG57_05390 [Endomicrobia bacterium]|nr:hypothetical protein [Endomicrobiia bacterium]
MKKMLTTLLCCGLLFAMTDYGKAAGGKAAEYFNMLAGGTFHMKARITAEDGSKMDMETFAKDGNVATTMISDSDGQTGRTVLKGNKMHVIIDSAKMIMVSESMDPKADFMQADGMVLTGSGSAMFDGRNLPYEEYTDKEGDGKTQFFFDGGKLAGIRNVVNGGKVDTVVLALDKNIPANAFDIPAGYNIIKN